MIAPLFRLAMTKKGEWRPTNLKQCAICTMTMRFPDVEADFDQFATTHGSCTTYVRSPGKFPSLIDNRWVLGSWATTHERYL